MVLLTIVLLLSGCWDEKNFNDTIHVPMIGISGSADDLEISFLLPAIERKTDEDRIITTNGASFYDAQLKADSSTHNQLDTSMLTSIIIEDKSTEQDIYHYLDSFYRDVRNRLGLVLLVSDGPAKDYIEYGKEFGQNVNTFYSDMATHLAEESLLPDQDLQIICTYLFDATIDAQIPYLTLNEQLEFPAVSGVALYSNRKFTGEIIPLKDMVVMQVLKNEIGKKALETILFEDAPLTYEVERIKRKVQTTKKSASLQYDIEISILNYAPDRLKNSAKRSDIEDEVASDLEKKANKLIHIMQQVQHDGLGIGRYFRAFEVEVFSEDTWRDYYQSLDISTSFSVKVHDTGIMD